MNKTRIAAPRGEIAPITLLVGNLAVRALSYAEHLDFLLSVRDEKFATMLQFFRNWGWLVIAAGSAIWLIYEFRRHRANMNARGSIGAVIFSTAFVAFLAGVMITVSATGSLPMIIQSYSGDPKSETCNAVVDTSRLTGFEDDYRLVLLCGASDPAIDPQEDTRIAVSSKFHINGGPIAMVAPFGALKEVWKNIPQPAPGQAIAIQLWHTLAVIPQDADPSTIKRASDVHRMNGRVVTDPIGGFGSTVVIIPSTPVPNVPSVHVRRPS
jgi:hypothetical protein